MSDASHGRAVSGSAREGIENIKDIVFGRRNRFDRKRYLYFYLFRFSRRILKALILDI